MPPITHYKGKDAVYRWELTDHRNALADLSEAQAISFTVKEQVTDADEHILFEKTLGDGITIVDDGSIDVTIVGADTAGIALVGSGTLHSATDAAELFAEGTAGRVLAVHDDAASPKEVLASDEKDRVALVIATCIEAQAGTTPPTFDIGETDDADKFLADALLSTAEAGDVLLAYGALAADKALIVTYADGAGEPAGEWAVSAIAVEAVTEPTETAHLVYDLQVVTKSGQVRVVEHDTFTLALPVKQGTPT